MLRASENHFLSLREASNRWRGKKQFPNGIIIFALFFLHAFVAAAQTGTSLSDTDLFSALNLDYPGLESVKADVAVTNLTAAKSDLAAYLRTRTNVIWNFDWHHPTNTVSYDKTQADQITNGIITVVGDTYAFPGGNIDWFYNYTTNPACGCATDNEWQWELNRTEFWPALGVAYWGTRDEGYAFAWVRQLRSWVAQCPVPAYRSNGYPSAWRTIEAGLRMGSGWPDSFFRFVLSPSVTSDDLALYLKSCIEHGRYLTNWYTSENFLTMEMNGLFTVGTVFPELKEAAGWRAFAAQKLFIEQTNQFLPDGVQNELTPRYHGDAVVNIAGIYQTALTNNRLAELPAGYLTNLEKAYEYFLGITAPNRVTPAFNDSGRENVISWLTTGYGYFTNRLDFLWIASSGGGIPPARVSWQFPYAGYGVMRSGWDTTANYLCFDAGALGYSSHRHEDKLNVVLWAYGREILYDNGGGAYDQSIWHIWGQSSYAHNTIVVDGLDQEGGDGATSLTDPDYVAQSPINLRWETDLYHDFAAGVYNRGYGGNYNNRPASQARRVLFVKPDVFVIADTLVPADSAVHTYQARWHLRTTNTALSALTKVVTTTDPGLANLAIVPCLGAGLAVTNISAQTSVSGSGATNLSEILGWDLSTTLSIRYPAATATHTFSGVGTQQLLTVFLPLPAGATNPIVLVSNTGPTSAEISLNDGRRLRVYADPNPARGIQFAEILANNSTNRYVGAGFVPPVISGLTNQWARPGTVLGPLPFTVTDDSPPANVAVTAHSLNQSLVADTNIVLSGSGTNHTLTLSLATNVSGTATIAVTALDPDGSTMSGSFDITVEPLPSTNTPPTATPGAGGIIRNAVLDFDLWTVASDGETPNSNLLFAVNHPTNGTVTLLADGHTARFIPATNFTGSAGFQYTVTDLGEDPREFLHYGFEPPDDLSTGRVLDGTTNSHDGTVLVIGTGSAQLASATPPALGAIDTQSILLAEHGDFNGAQINRAVNASELNFSDQDWTFACWFKRAHSTNDDFIFHLGSGDGYGSDDELQICCPGGTSRVVLQHWNGMAQNLGLTSGSTAATGQWHHVAMTFTRAGSKAGNVAFYLDGILVGTSNNVPFNLNQNYPVVLGGHPTTTFAVYRWFDGCLDDAVIFRAALSASEISRLAASAVSRFGGLSATSTVAVTVSPSNTAPVFSVGVDQTINAGTVFVITNTATDTDAPPQTLAFNLVTAPANATLDPASGVFTWRPYVAQAGSTNPVKLAVTDDGMPPLSATQVFTIFVNPVLPPQLGALASSNEFWSMTVSGQWGPDYMIFASSNLTAWTAIATNYSPTQSFNWVDTTSTNFTQRFYRVRLGP